MFASGESGGSGLRMPQGIPGFQEESAFSKICPNLSFKQRIMGFIGCAGVGWLLSLIGTLTLIGGPSAKNINAFVVLYVLGNIIALVATGFLLGPKSQCNKMWHPTRRYTTAFYLTMLIIVFAVAVAKQNIGIVIVLLLIQIMAAIWYSISFIPFARKMVGQMMRSTGLCKPCFDVYDQWKVGGGESAPTGAKGRFTQLNDN